MHARPNPVEALASLIRLESAGERRASWRQAIAALGQRAGSGLASAPPLEGMAQEVIARAAELAIELGLADDLDWLAPGPATVALYELTAALPPGKTRRELGRRVFARLYQGTASTFAAVAARMALTSARPFEPSTLRARVSLLFDLPIGSNVNADPLALTLVTRRELSERWIENNKTGTLPARRLAAKLIEHAAREAVSRFQQGDSAPREVLSGERLRGTIATLLADREPLVWRHIAVARGLLATIDGALREEIEQSMDPALTPTEWRRGAVSLVALCAGDPDGALPSCRNVLEGPLVEIDRGLPAALVLGLPRVIEAEPAAAEELLRGLASTQRPDVAEAVAALLSDLRHTTLGADAARDLRQTLTARAEHQSSVLRAIAERALRQLDREEDDSDVLGLVRKALLAYENLGAREAFEIASQAVKALGRAMDFVSINDPHDEQVLPYVLGTLSDIDGAALERPRLSDLLLLGRRPGDTDVSVPEMDKLYDRLGRWILHAEAARPKARSNALALGEQRRLRTLLHLMDVDCTRQEDDKKVQTRISRALTLLLDRVKDGEGASVHRIACAALARACDAAVREGIAEPADLLLLLATNHDNPSSYRAITEASTHPDVRGVMQAYADFLVPPTFEGSEPPPELVTLHPMRAGESEQAARIAERVLRLSRGLGAGGSYRGEALRRIVLRLARALELVARARGQTELFDTSGTGVDVLSDVEAALDELNRLARGARRRLVGEDEHDIAVVAEVPPISALVERSVRAGVPANPEQLAMAIREAVAQVPEPLGDAVKRVLHGLSALPVAAPSDVFAIPLERRRTQLPDWLLPHRTIGAFYVVRPLGSGGASSVFLARRSEERNNPKVEGVALKVPDYDPTTARSLSEQEFLQLFREEAGALLSLPEHPNLARFVTFDAGARPKPILVMELIRGASLDRLIRSRSLTTEQAFAYIDGILAGLEAMHGAGVGHLDVKPSNVILRDGQMPVLVDFGLSGRHLRPGCGTLEYSAPEVLGIAPADCVLSPLPTDLYALACTAFEALTAELLFDADDEATIMGLHAGHDGWPPRLTPFAHAPDTLELAKLLAACLRRDPRNRPSASQARRAFAKVAARLAHVSWPLVPSKPQRAAG
ncbi:MAG: serine/threonine-protein kinase [Polyangiaceae bacterium]